MPRLTRARVRWKRAVCRNVIAKCYRWLFARGQNNGLIRVRMDCRARCCTKEPVTVFSAPHVSYFCASLWTIVAIKRTIIIVYAIMIINETLLIGPLADCVDNKARLMWLMKPPQAGALNKHCCASGCAVVPVVASFSRVYRCASIDFFSVA